MKQKEIVIYHETVLQSIVTDIFTIGSLVAAVSIGRWIGSDALQWIAGIMAVLTIVSTKSKYRSTFTDIEKAKAHLDTLKS